MILLWDEEKQGQGEMRWNCGIITPGWLASVGESRLRRGRGTSGAAAGWEGALGKEFSKKANIQGRGSHVGKGMLRRERLPQQADG